MNAVAGEHLAGLIGHEVRNPLASAMTGAMLARDMVDDGDPRSAVLDGVLRDLDRMTDLIDGWLALARGRAPAVERIDLENLLTSVSRRHRAELLCCPPSVDLRGNRVMIERALDNLCENARNAGASSIRIAAQHAGGAICIHIEDDGKGIAPEAAERVFEPGWSDGGSTGLGLYAVATTLSAVDGSIRCVPLPKGTRFSVTLPRAEMVTA